MIIESRRSFPLGRRHRMRGKRRNHWYVYVGPRAGRVMRRFRTGRKAVAFALAQAGERVLERHTFRKGRRDLTVWRWEAERE